MTDQEIIDCAIDLSRGRPSAELLSKGPEHNLAPLGWFPKLRGRFVRNADDPADGFRDRRGAIEAARKYRSGCVAFVARAKQAAKEQRRKYHEREIAAGRMVVMSAADVFGRR